MEVILQSQLITMIIVYLPVWVVKESKISYEHNEQKVAEFIKEDSIKKAIANDLKEIENLDIK